ncbi:MAG: IS21 family transposase, partial [Culicoidibacterales bacterium]
MSQINNIKNMYENERLSFDEIVRQTGLNWRTVKKHALAPVQSLEKKQQRVKKLTLLEKSGLDTVIIDWLIEDTKVSRKQVRTARRMHIELVENHGFKGSYRCVADYVKKQKVALEIAKQKKYAHLDIPPGEAQLDYGTYLVVIDGKYVKAHVLILSFKQSNCAVAFATPGENTESFLHALQEMFTQLHGVPTHIWIDNLAAAVISIGKGSERKYTDDFLKFTQFCRFKVNPCNAYSGNEKGHVESKVKYVRNRFFVPEPVFDDWEHLNTYLAKELQGDRERIHYEIKENQSHLWLNDEAMLLPLQHHPYIIQRFDKRKVNKYGEIKFENATITVPYGIPGQIVTLILTWNKYELISSSGEHLAFGHRDYMNKAVEINWIPI